MEFEISQVAQRIKGLREILEITPEEMARITELSLEEYLACEEGRSDFSFSFLYKCAKRFGVDITELITGDVPKLSFYEVVRKGSGLPINRREGFQYQNIAYLFKNKIAEPYIVTAKYSEEEQNRPIHLSSHKGQELDYILKGSLKVQLEDHIEILSEGDSLYYDSGHGHGMIAAGGEDCIFLAVVMEKK